MHLAAGLGTCNYDDLARTRIFVHHCKACLLAYKLAGAARRDEQRVGTRFTGPLHSSDHEWYRTRKAPRAQTRHDPFHRIR